MESEQHAETPHPEVTSPRQKPKLVEQIKEKFSAVKEKIIGHHESPPVSPDNPKGHGAHDLLHADQRHATHEHASSPRGAMQSHLKYEDIPIPEGGLIMTAAPEEPEIPDEHHHGIKDKIKSVFDFPVPDTTVTPVKDFEETVPPNLKI